MTYCDIDSRELTTAMKYNTLETKSSDAPKAPLPQPKPMIGSFEIEKSHD